MIIYTEVQHDNTIKEMVKIIDEEKQLVIAKGFIIIDYKEEGKPSATIENIWTHEDYRNKGYGKQVVKKLTDIAKERGCYKTVLICDISNIAFYEKCGFYEHQHGMRIDL